MKHAALQVVAGFHGTALGPELKELIDAGIGGVVVFSRNIEEPDQLAELIEAIRAHASRPLLVTVDQEGGTVARIREPGTRWPNAAVYARTDDPHLVAAAGTALAKEIRAFGFNLDFAPVLDVMTNPANPVIGPRAFGEQAQTVIRWAGAWIEGVHATHTGTCGKHFPGHGDTSEDSHVTLPVCSLTEQTLRASHIKPFLDLRGVIDTIMTAHVMYPALDPNWPATLSPKIIDGMLRSEIGFDGLVFTDDLEMDAMKSFGDARVVAHQALEAGNDIVLACHTPEVIEACIAAARDTATLSIGHEQRCTKSLLRRTDFLKKYPDSGPWSRKERNLILGCQEHQDLARTFTKWDTSNEYALQTPVVDT